MSDNPEPNMTPRYWTITKVVRDTEPQSVNKMLSEGWVLLRVYTAYEVTGYSMAPEIPSGARVIVRVQDYASPGNEIVCWVPEYGMLVKRLEKLTNDGQYVLTSYNPTHRPIWSADVHIYGVVVEIRTRRKVVNGTPVNGHGPN